MSYTEHDETMDSRSLDGITASGAAESSPVGVSQEAPGVERADPAGDRTEGIAPVLEAGTPLYCSIYFLSPQRHPYR